MGMIGKIGSHFLGEEAWGSVPLRGTVARRDARPTADI